jgi:multidrug resistance efflux pump
MGEEYMKKYTKIGITLVVLSMLVFSACSALPIGNTPEPEETEIPVVQADLGIIAEGRLVPSEFVNLSFKSGGQVHEVLFEEGEVVSEGDVIAMLGNREQLEVAVANAELEKLSAEQALDALYESAEVNTALAMQAITDAQDARRDAERYINNLNAGSRQTDIDSSKADLVFLKDALDNAREDYQPYENKDEDNLKRATFLSKLADAQEKYDNAVRLLNNLQGSPSELDMAIAEADLSVAEAQLALAESNYEKVKEGPDPDDLAAAEARITAAESNLVAAETALENIELVAPFSGTLVDLGLKVGEQVSPGTPVVVLADFAKRKVETDDLTEIEVPDIYVGQPVTVTPDALPDLELKGTVESISDLYEEKRGDVTYTARILLDEDDERLRWGMTVVVTFEE